MPFGVESVNSTSIFPIKPYDILNISAGYPVKIPRGIMIDTSITNLLLSAYSPYTHNSDTNTCMPHWIVLAPRDVLESTFSYMEKFSGYEGRIGLLRLLCNPDVFPPKDCPDYCALFDMQKYEYFKRVSVLGAVFANEEFCREVVGSEKL